MKSLTTKLFTLLLTALLVLPQAGSSQTFTLSNTTLNGAITAAATTLVLTSASASSGSSFGAPAAGQCLFIDQELMRIVSMASTTATVTRARGGGTVSNAPAPHATLAVIWTGSCNAFQSADPIASGNQTCTSQPRPWINVNNGNVWFCNTVNNLWRGTNAYTFAYGSSPVAQ